MSYRIQSSTVTAPQRNATRSRACKDAREQNSFNVHKKNEKDLLPSELMETPKYTETHKGAQKKGQREPNGAKSSQEPLRKDDAGLVQVRESQSAQQAPESSG